MESRHVGSNGKAHLSFFDRCAFRTKLYYERLGAHVHKPHADFLLGFLFYLEAIFFIPTDPMLIIYCFELPQRALAFASIATFGSVLGGMTSYALGALLWDTVGPQIIHNRIINYILTPEGFAYLSAQYRTHEWLAILIAGFTPIPYKAATLTAGFCKLSIVPFIICSAIARGARFFMLAIIIKLFGNRIKESLNQYLTALTLAAAVIVIGAWFVLR